MLKSMIAATLLFVSTAGFSHGLETEVREYICGNDHLVQEIQFTGSCTLWLPNDAYIYGPICDDIASEEAPWTEYDVVFNRAGFLQSFEGHRCKLL